tara:strand:- start:11 stop:151 length:141 start_codon:yes stop_codon:yes gene_type:complete
MRRISSTLLPETTTILIWTADQKMTPVEGDDEKQRHDPPGKEIAHR